ncbi:MAG: peptide-N-glycosidase F-related protein [Candidatus Kapaibacteriota bacterium]
MKRIFFIFWLGFSLLLYGKDGDTIKVKTIEFGQSKLGWFNFPDSSKSFQKILMNYKIKCPCGEWDYLAMVFVKQFFAPSFRVDSIVVPEYSFMFDTSWSYSSRMVNGRLVIDSFPKKPRLLEFYNDSVNPTRRTSFRYVWDPYYRYLYDNNGNVLDSVLVPPDSTIYLTKRRIYFEDPIAITERYEIMRYVTPYGIGLDVGDGFTWTMDVTDFAPLLVGKVYLDAPNQQEPIEITFDFIEGVPERNIIRLERIYDFYDVVYDKHFEEKISKKQVQTSPKEKMFRLKVIQTGHGFGGNEDNCCEFCKKNAYVKVNDTIRYTKEVWRICSTNPLYPQGGTWLFNRTNWCPGAEVQPYDFELTPFIGNMRSFTFDYDMDYYDKPYSSGSNTIGRWIITAYLISYSDLNFVRDAEIYDIISPSTKDVYKRVNPSTTVHTIVVKNRGKEEIKSIKLKYGIVGGKEYYYTWSGSINSLETKYIDLPPIACSEWNSNSKVFRVEILEVNGKPDEYHSNNVGYSIFKMPPSVYKNLSVIVKTNNFNVLNNDPNFIPYRVRITDSSGLVLMEQTYSTPNSETESVVQLKDGCYSLLFESFLECGLGFWFYRQFYGLTDGLFQLRSDNLVLYQPGVDFGSFIYYSFIAEDQPTVTVQPDTVDFGNVPQNSERFMNIIIRPMNRKEISVWDFKVVLGETKGFSIDRIEPEPGVGQNWTVGKEDSIKVILKFSPKKIGKVSSSLTFSSNDKKKPLVSVPLKANVLGGSDVEFVNDYFDIFLASKDKKRFEFVFNANPPAGSLACDVYNVMGGKLSGVSEINYLTNKVLIDMSSFANGLYFVKFNLGKFVKIIPIIIFDD